MSIITLERGPSEIYGDSLRVLGGIVSSQDADAFSELMNIYPGFCRDKTQTDAQALMDSGGLQTQQGQFVFGAESTLRAVRNGIDLFASTQPVEIEPSFKDRTVAVFKRISNRVFPSDDLETLDNRRVLPTWDKKFISIGGARRPLDSGRLALAVSETVAEVLPPLLGKSEY